LVAALLTTLVGAILGAVAGYRGGWLDAFLMRLADVMMCIPSLFLVLVLIVLLGPGLQNVVLVIVVTGWTGMARQVRAEVMTLREREYVMAARASGARSWSILARHVLPNAMAPVYVSLTFGVAGAILMESSLSFLGLGVQAPQASWGSLLNSGRESIEQAWWLTVFPGLLIFTIMMLVNHLGEQARQYFDPKDAG
jgi:peptide/nickel transport system permease protein